MKPALLFALLLAASPAAFPYQTTSSRSSVDGQVVNPDTGAPMRNVSVTINATYGQPIRPGQPPTPHFSNTVDTDDQGRFSFEGLAAGGYQLRAMRRGAQSYNGSGTTVFVGEQQQLKGLVVKLASQSVVTGRVLDEYGEPVQNAQVMLGRLIFPNGKPQWTSVGSAQTSDLGEYRIPVTNPGSYLVSASMREFGMRSGSWNQALPQKPELAYITTYYPSATDPARAAKVVVGRSGEIRGIDIQLQRVPTVRIRGRVFDPSAPTNRPPSVTLAPKGGGPAPMMGPSSTTFTNDGEFEISGVTPGSYTLLAQKYLSTDNVIGPSTSSLTAAMPIEVGDKSISGIHLKLEGGKDVQGVIVRQGNATALLQITANQVDSNYFGPMPAARNVSGPSFTLTNVAARRYVVNAIVSSPDAYVKSVRYGGKEIPMDGVDLTSGEKLEIVVAADGGRLEGIVRSSDGKVVTGGIVVIRGLGAAAPYFSNTRSNANGEFRTAMLPPGEYQVFACEENVDQMSLQDPDFLKGFEAHAQSAKVASGGTATMTLSAFAKAGAVDSAPEQHFKGSVEGRVVSSTTGLPIPRATVRLGNNMAAHNGMGVVNTGASNLSVEADDQGHFILHDVEPGLYPLVAEHQGFINGTYPESRSNTVDRMVVGEGQNVHNAIVKLAPQGVISGKVLDEQGAPLERVRVQVYRRSHVAGQTQFRPFPATTDDLGEYRIPSLAAGDYILAAQLLAPTYVTSGPLPEQPDNVYPITYFPNVVDYAKAKPIVLEAGAHVANIDITLHKAPLLRIRGKLLDPKGPPPRTYTLALQPREGGAQPNGIAPRTARNSDGEFEISGVEPGAYMLIARVTEQGQSRVATHSIDLKDKSIDGVTLQLAPGRDITASVTIEGKMPQNLGGLYATLIGFDGSMIGGSQGMYDGSGLTFRNVPSIPASVRVTNLSPDCNCYVESITYGGHEIPPSGVVLTNGETLAIVLSSGAAIVEGTVLNARGVPVPGAVVAIVSKDGSPENLKTGTADSHGKFYWPGNAPGEYKLFAWEEVDFSSLEAPSALQQFDAKATLVSLGPDARETVQLTAIGVPVK